MDFFERILFEAARVGATSLTVDANFSGDYAVAILTDLNAQKREELARRVHQHIAMSPSLFVVVGP